MPIMCTTACRVLLYPVLVLLACVFNILLFSWFFMNFIAYGMTVEFSLFLLFPLCPSTRLDALPLTQAGIFTRVIMEAILIITIHFMFDVFSLTLRYILKKPVWEKEGQPLPIYSPKCERSSSNYLPVARRGCILFLTP